MLKDLWEKNTKIIIICLIIVLCILIGVYIVISPSSSNSIVQKEEVENKEIDKIVLFGQRTITLKEGENYVEPGYYAVTKDGEIKKDEVEVTGNEINGKESGTYYISYTIGNKKEERKIIIEEAEREEEKEQEGEVTLTLNGENMMILNIGSEYIEPGYKAIDTKEGDITNKVKVAGKVNTGKVGTYEIRYEVENSSSKKEVKIRQVVVKNDILKVNITGNSTNYTNQNVNLKIEVEGENFNYIKYPDGTVSKNKISNYEINKNGTYKFLIYDLENNYIKKEIVVDRIDKTSPTGSCTATIKDGQTKIVVNARDTVSGIKNYVYYGDGKEINNQTGVTYTYNKQLSNAYVNIYDNAGNLSKIVCNVPEVVVNGDCTATLKDGKTKYVVTGNNIKSYKYNGEYESNNATYTLSKYIRKNNFVMVTDINGKETKINCTTKMEALPAIKPTGKIVKQEETKTLKVYVEDYKKYYLTYIWAKDPSEQLNKEMIPDNSSGLVAPKDILNTALSKHNLKNKLTIGFNASSMVGKLSNTMWPYKGLRNTIYNHKEASPLLLYNGKVIINDYDKYQVNSSIYFVDGSNQLGYIPELKNKSSEERKKIFQEVIDSGARNTFRFGSILNYDYKIYDDTKGAVARKQAICQIDTNNFVLLTSKNASRTENDITDYDIKKQYEKIGCRMGVRLDGGGSTTLYFKSQNDTSFTSKNRLVGGERKNSTMMYFTE